MKLVFLLEEKSMEYALVNLLPKLLPEEINYQLVSHSGKSDLKNSISVKLRGWNEPDVKFVILHDKDSNDCVELKKELVDRTILGGRNDSLVRIVCTELESWFLGDLNAVESAYNINLSNIKYKSTYRNPDKISNAKQILSKIIKSDYQTGIGAKTISKHMDIESNSSYSFNVFISGVRKMIT